MIKLKKLTLTLVALLSTAAGAWAQTENEVTVNRDGENNKWTFTMPASNVELQVEYVPSYNVTFNTEGLDAEEAAKFTATPNTGVYKDETVTVSYTGSKRLIGFKAVKKRAAPTAYALAESTVGMIVGSDGKAYAAADKDNLPSGVTAVAMIAYVGSSTDHATYTHGLAIALADESNSDWSTAKSTCEGKSAVTNAAWQLPSQNQWKAMFSANGGNEGQYTGLNTAITTAGGTALQGDVPYWSSTPSGYDDGTAYNVLLGGGGAEWYRDYYEEGGYRVRACLAF